MNLVLNYFGKEWRARRQLLVAFMLLATSCLCLGVYLMRQAQQTAQHVATRGASWFVTVGVLAVVFRVAPSLARSELVGMDDQFIRRLPSALGQWSRPA